MFINLPGKEKDTLLGSSEKYITKYIHQEFFLGRKAQMWLFQIEFGPNLPETTKRENSTAKGGQVCGMNIIVNLNSLRPRDFAFKQK